MIRAIFVVLVAALIFGVVPKTSQATPIAPLTGVTIDHSNLTQVWWVRRVGVSAADEIEKLDRLKKAGSISDAEFSRLRGKLVQ